MHHGRCRLCYSGYINISHMNTYNCHSYFIPPEKERWLHSQPWSLYATCYRVARQINQTPSMYISWQSKGYCAELCEEVRQFGSNALGSTRCFSRREVGIAVRRGREASWVRRYSDVLHEPWLLFTTKSNCFDERVWFAARLSANMLARVCVPSTTFRRSVRRLGGEL